MEGVDSLDPVGPITLLNIFESFCATSQNCEPKLERRDLGKN